MWNLIRNGGFVPMTFILAFGLLGLGAAFYFALRSDPRTLAFVRSIATATLFATLAATSADVGATLFAAEKAFDATGSFASSPGPPQRTEADATSRALHIVVAGLAESNSPTILGFSFLAVTWMLVAVGRRRLAEVERAP